MEPKSIDRIFWDAAQIASPSEREAYLAQACACDVKMRDRIEQLLQARSKAESFLESPAPALTTTVDEPITERPGTVIGPYKLLEQIGEGGFGLVFMAEQQQPIRRKVALKILKPGMDTRQVIARFEAERQALALMDHPNIAKVLEGGETASGQPYFVMDLVKGVPITEYCDQNTLATRERLGLFVSVCQAIQHAHQKGIIHRDIKPSNVLVTLHDGSPLVKVIDFGIAKALGQQLTDKTLFTGFAQMIGTPLYMSPEQAALSNVDVDTRSDIYSLGVLLYELLTGTTPFDKERLKEASYDEMRRIIREEEPPKPSTRISTLGQAATTMCTQRKSDPRRLSQLCRGELDWIVMKCLEKDRNRRYETASAFAADVQRYLKDEPVEARPASTGYRLRKFLRRNKGPVVTAAVICLLLLGGIIGTTWGLVRAGQALRSEGDRAKAEARAKELAQSRLEQIEKANDILESIFKNLDPKAEEKGGPALRVQLGEQLDQAAKLLEGEAVGEPLTVARLQDVLGKSLQALGQFNKAQSLLEKAREMREAALGPDHPDSLQSKNNLAALYHVQGKYVPAEVLYQEVLQAQTARLGADHAVTLIIKNNLAVLYHHQGKYARAETLCQDVLQVQTAKLGADHSETLTSKNNLAGLYHDQGKYAEADQLFQEVLRARTAKLGADHPDALESKHNLAYLYKTQGNYQRAEQLLQEVLRARTAKLGADHPDTLGSKHNLALLYRDQGEYDQAESLCREVLQGFVAKLGADHPDTLNSKVALANLYHHQGKYNRAELLYQEVLQAFAVRLGPDHPLTVTSKHNLAGLYQDQGKYNRAEPLYQEVLQARTAMLGADHPDTLNTKNNLASLYHRQGKHDRAEPLYQEVLQARTTMLGADHPQTLESKNSLAVLYWQQARYGRAEPLFLEVLQARMAKLGADHPDTLNSKNNLASLYHRQGKYDHAEPLYQEVLQARMAKLGADHPATLDSKNNLAGLYKDRGQYVVAGPLFEQVLQARTAKLGADHPDTLNSKNNLASLYKAQGLYAQGELLFREAVAGARSKLGLAHPSTQIYIHNLSDCYERMGQPAKAEPLYSELAEFCKHQAGADSPQYAAQLALLGRNLLAQNKPAEAEPVLRDCLAIRAKKEPDAWATFNTKSMLGGAFLGQKKYAEAEPLLLHGYDGMKQREAKMPREGKLRLTEGLERLVQLYGAWGKKEKESEWETKLQAQLDAEKKSEELKQK